MSKLFNALCVVTLITIAACSTIKPYYNKESADWKEKPVPLSGLQYTVYLIGDAGEPSQSDQEPTFRLLETMLNNEGEQSSIIFLGDNIYPAGLPKSSDEDKREEAEAKLNEQLDILKNYQGQVFFIPGNHDWNHWKAGGLKAVNRQENYVEEYLDKGNVFLPDDGCGDPVEIQLTDDLVLIIFDSQWWLHDWKKEPKINKGCEITTKAEFIAELGDIVNRNLDKEILVAMHHPFYSNGSHGGYFSAKEHIFPLTAAHESLFLPLAGYRLIISWIS